MQADSLPTELFVFIFKSFKSSLHILGNIYQIYLLQIFSPQARPTRLLCLWGFSRQNTGVSCHAPPGDLPNSGIEPRSPALQVDSLPSEPPGKPKNTGVGSLSLLQGIFLTQELNQGLLRCRGILYQLRSQGSPRILEWVAMPSSKGSSQHRD